MSANERRALTRGSLLPRLVLPHSTDDSHAPLLAGRGPLILLLMHSGSCAGCMDYLRALIDMEADAMGARIVGVMPDSCRAARPMPVEDRVAMALLTDSARVLADGVARIVAADEWGEIYNCELLGSGHDVPAPREAIEWAEFIAVQCPECEGPEGEWRSL